MDTSLKRIDKYNVVSFDIFDTLLKRDVYKPTDVFQLVQEEANRRFNIDLAFKKVRIEAERKAREKSSYSEITLNEIYEEIDIQDKEKFKSLELKIENSVLHCNYNIKPIYDRCIALGKDVFIISDMYLPTNFLEKVLKREGFDGYKRLVVSADYRKTKQSGDLFRALLESFNINSNEIIHIGDSWFADFIGPRKAKLAGIHILRVVKNTLYTPVPAKNSSFETRLLFAFVNSRVGRFKNRDEKLGYEVIGPILYSYCKWIHNRYEEVRSSQSRLWFAARDMYLFKVAYEIIYGESDVSYLYISRRSLRPILTYTTGDIAESGKVFSRGMYTIQEIVQKMGYAVKDLTDENYDEEARYNIRELKEYEDIRRLLSSNAILNKESELAEVGIKYLEDNGLFDSDVILADIGWHGTTQYILKRIQESVTEKGSILGLYLGCLDSTNERIGKENYKAFAFNEEEDNDFAKGILLFESLILAPHGSTRKYINNNGNIIPELGEPDNISDFLKNVQKGAIQFVKEFKASIFGDNMELTAQVSTHAFCKLAMSPLKEELETIGNLDYEDFGIKKMAAPKPIIKYVFHPRGLYHDLKHSPWRIGFLYKLFKMRLPYARIYSFVRKRRGKLT